MLLEIAKLPVSGRAYTEEEVFKMSPCPQIVGSYCRLYCPAFRQFSETHGYCGLAGPPTAYEIGEMMKQEEAK